MLSDVEDVCIARDEELRGLEGEPAAGVDIGGADEPAEEEEEAFASGATHRLHLHTTYSHIFPLSFLGGLFLCLTPFGNNSN